MDTSIVYTMEELLGEFASDKIQTHPHPDICKKSTENRSINTKA